VKTHINTVYSLLLGRRLESVLGILLVQPLEIFLCQVGVHCFVQELSLRRGELLTVERYRHTDKVFAFRTVRPEIGDSCA
jgi:hypothetical protein